MTTGDVRKLSGWGLADEDARGLLVELERSERLAPADRWQRLQREWLSVAQPFELDLWLYQQIYGEQALKDDPQPVWFPDQATLRQARVSRWQTRCECESVDELHRWSVENREEFWRQVIDELDVPFVEQPHAVWNLGAGVASPVYLPGGVMNIAAACFGGDLSRQAIAYADEEGRRECWSAENLQEQVTRVAGALRASGCAPGFRAAVMMPMTPESVAIYLGIIWAGGAVVAIADSFAPPEVATRIEIAAADMLFVQGMYQRAGKPIELYRRLLQVDLPPCIVVGNAELKRVEDRSYHAWLERGTPLAQPAPCDPMEVTNYLFSSGTTGSPKAIPWSHATPIKCAADAMFHQDVRAGDVVAWPTNLGWMMGPWLIYASLMNEASMALYGGSPISAKFAEFVEHRRVTMLGVVPSLVRAWREQGTIEGVDWSAIRSFSSTGECSQAEDMFYLMSRAGYRPMIEYCGGTELAGGYITSTVVEPSAPSVFTTPAMGLDFAIFDEEGEATDSGEVFLVPPSFGLSTTLLNRDHHEAYFTGVPTMSAGRTLRRHGDLVERLGPRRYRVLGRADDTMNLGGIKVSSAEIERIAASIEGIREAAAVAVPPPGGGPSRLLIYAVLTDAEKVDVSALTDLVRVQIKRQLNPLFKLEQLVVVESLPRTASNKIMRRKLRER